MKKPSQLYGRLTIDLPQDIQAIIKSEFDAHRKNKFKVAIIAQPVVGTGELRMLFIRQKMVRDINKVMNKYLKS